MAQIVEVVRDTLKGVYQAANDTEAEQLKAQLEFIKGLGGAELGVDAALELVQGGKLADLFIAQEIELTAELQLTTTRVRETNVGGSISAGPVQINASYRTGLTQNTGSTATVKINSVRLSKSNAMQNLVTGIDDIKRLLTDAGSQN